MAKTSNDYYTEGRTDRADNRKPMALKPGWQQQAYARGYYEEAAPVSAAAWKALPARNGAQPLDIRGKHPTLLAALDERRREHFAHWPEAAREHFFRLVNDLAAETALARQERLFRACQRMVKRHGQPSELAGA